MNVQMNVYVQLIMFYGQNLSIFDRTLPRNMSSLSF